MPFVDKPIINSPFKDPTCYYKRLNNEFILEEGRRPSGFWNRRKIKNGGSAEEFNALPLVDEFRIKIAEWREQNYPQTTSTTKLLLTHWNYSGRLQKLFFCQLELIETMIWLVEVASEKTRKKIPLDTPLNLDNSTVYKAFLRYCGKMATGTGKTLVMGCLITWQILNHVYNPADPRFTNNILVVTPNRTVRQRDWMALDPAHPDNDYRSFGLVPPNQFELLLRGNIFITNWHFFLLKDDSNKKSVMKKGRESNAAFVLRVKRDGFMQFNESKPIFILNDEAHHAYRSSKAAIESSAEVYEKKMRKQIAELEELIKAIDEPQYFHELEISGVKRNQKLAKRVLGIHKFEEIEIRRKIARYHQEKDPKHPLHPNSSGMNNPLTEATAWVGGLDRLHQLCRINYCIDLSATPFYHKSAGYREGTPFPWIISDFSLADAIESGLTKIPRYPLMDNNEETKGKYYHLWEWITKKLKTAGIKKPKSDPEALLREAQDVLVMLADRWKRTREIFTHNQYNVPPLMIIICNDTKTSGVFFNALSSGHPIEEFKNPTNKSLLYTLKIDTKALADAESFLGGIDVNKSKEETFRELVANIGKAHTNGKDVRCLVSVQMLSEGWDAHNVTQILGMRAFSSSLLCEQVVGRGLRRMNYDCLDGPIDQITEEYVDVYGIPFETLPAKGETCTSIPQPKSTHLITADPKNLKYEIKFPRVEGYMQWVQNRLKINYSQFDSIKFIEKIQAEVPDTGNIPSFLRVNKIINEIAHSVLHKYLQLHFKNEEGGDELVSGQRFQHFPQIYHITRDFIQKYVFPEVPTPERKIFLFHHQQEIITQLTALIEPDAKSSLRQTFPRMDRFKPIGSTGDVHFRTTKSTQCKNTKKCHLNSILCEDERILDIKEILEASHIVHSYVRNDHLGFSIPGLSASPDFLINVGMKKKRTNIILSLGSGLSRDKETKVMEDQAIARWVEAVNNSGEVEAEYGHWMALRKNPNEDLDELISQKMQ